MLVRHYHLVCRSQNITLLRQVQASTPARMLGKVHSDQQQVNVYFQWEEAAGSADSGYCSDHTLCLYQIDSFHSAGCSPHQPQATSTLQGWQQDLCLKPMHTCENQHRYCPEKCCTYDCSTYWELKSVMGCIH